MKQSTLFLLLLNITLLQIAPLWAVGPAPHAMETLSGTNQTGRETVIMMDADNGRIMRLDNSETAVETSFPPGSLIKIFSALYGLRNGIIQPNTVVRCRGSIKINGKQYNCWNPRGHGNVNLYKALAYSCNIYFCRYGARISIRDYLNYLKTFGFGSKTRLDVASEHPGHLPEETDLHEQIQLFSGLGGHMEVTPIQMAVAFSALVNRGKRLIPVLTSAAEAPRYREQLEIAPYLPIIQRSLTEGSIYGTTAGFNKISNGYGKTGTAQWTVGYRTHGWFVGYIPIHTESGIKPIVLVVFKTDGTGNKDALPAALKITQQFKQRTQDQQEVTVSLFSLVKPTTLSLRTRSTRLEIQTGEDIFHCRRIVISLTPAGLRIIADNQPHDVAAEKEIRIHYENKNNQPIILQVEPDRKSAGKPSTREYRGSLSISPQSGVLEIQNRLPLATYLEGVIGSEIGTYADTLNALKSQAVVSRTYALKNRNRHGSYDFCDTTHCQYYTGLLDVGEQVKQAVAETAGQVLIYNGELCDVYYHSTCGGFTNPYNGVWDNRNIPYLESIDDRELCKESPHYRWQLEISQARLFPLFQESGRPAVQKLRIKTVDHGGWIRRLVVVYADGTEREYSGEEFHILIGRKLGWNKFKSSNFTIKQQGESLRFSGRGLGHGVGMCQWGVRRLARQGEHPAHILNHYFPRTIISRK